jgi:starch synthase
MNVVFVASEAVPFAKTGGLADVIGTLPCALSRLGLHVSVVIPCHREVWWRSGQAIEETGRSVRVPVGPRSEEAVIYRSLLPGSDVTVYLIGHARYFDRDHLYLGPDGRDFPDNAERFAFFARAALETIGLMDARPDVVHCHDWQTALIPLESKRFHRAGLGGVATLLTIHNMAYQGSFDASCLAPTGLDRRLFNWRQLECYGRVNYLKAGIVNADTVSTVSPTYAREIQTSEFGCGLEGLLRSRRDDLVGIVNGIDVSQWGPDQEPMIARPYTVTNFEEGKAACKAALQRRALFPERPDVPLFAQIGRLDPQKGWDLLIDLADDFLRGDVQLVVLGEGHRRYHERLDWLANRHPGKLRVFLEFSTSLSHQIEAGADLFLMPSLYEPCGLNQLYSLAHGTVPVVRATGGLADTVVDATPATLADGTATGFTFLEPTSSALRAAIARALSFRADRASWTRLIENGMRADWSWDRSARQYVSLYDEAIRRTRARRESGVSLAIST